MTPNARKVPINVLPIEGRYLANQIDDSQLKRGFGNGKAGDKKVSVNEVQKIWSQSDSLQKSFSQEDINLLVKDIKEQNSLLRTAVRFIAGLVS